jgi:hypothetical protein
MLSFDAFPHGLDPLRTYGLRKSGRSRPATTNLTLYGPFPGVTMPATGLLGPAVPIGVVLAALLFVLRD